MVEATINLNFSEHLVRRRMKPKRRWFRRILDRMIFKDHEEYLDNLHLPFQRRYSVVKRLSQLNDRSGYTRVFVSELEKIILGIPIRERPSSIRILDIGAGGGGLLRAIYAWSKRKNISVELAGIDSSGDFVVVTESNLTNCGIPVKMYWANASNLSDIEDDSFDVVVSSYLVHHIRAAGKVGCFFSEVYRIARYGWLIADLDRRLYGPTFVGLTGFLLSFSPTLVSDGIKSAQRAYSVQDINFILGEVSRITGRRGMDCRAYPFFPYWQIQGRKIR